jgi:protein translocase SecG subunit
VETAVILDFATAEALAPLAVTLGGVFQGIVLVLFVLCSLLLIAVILLQEGKGGGLAGAFGGAAADTFGVKAGTVNRFTAILGGVFVALALTHAGIVKTRTQSVIAPPPDEVKPAPLGPPRGTTTTPPALPPEDTTPPPTPPTTPPPAPPATPPAPPGGNGGAPPPGEVPGGAPPSPPETPPPAPGGGTPPVPPETPPPGGGG